MTRGFVAAFGAALLGAWALAAAPPTPTLPREGGGLEKGADTADDVQDVVLLADARPVLLRLHITVDGRPFRAAHREALDAYLAGLFQQLDANGDSVLSEEEARRMPPPFKPPADAGSAMVHVAFNYRVVDADGDGKITREEMAEYYREFSGGPVQVQPTPRAPIPPQVDQALFDLLDTNKDGKISKEELAAAADVLLPLDQDHDELVSPQEMAPSLYAVAGSPTTGTVPPPPGMQRGPQGASLFLVSTDEDRAALASVLMARYGAANRDKAPDAEVVVRLGRGAGVPEQTLTFGPVRLDLQVNEDRPQQPAGTRRRVLELFRGLAGEKGRLTAAQARQGGFFPAEFALLDQNGDGELTEQELANYLDHVQDGQARLIAATPSLLFSTRARGLFEWLDRDRDGRLSLRELREAPQLLARMGLEKEGSVTRADLPEGYRLAIGAGQANLGRAGPAPFTPREAPMLTLDWSGPDLLWFRKMDRNRDGDVSRREFLGTPDDFRRLDADGDGLISRDEAEHAVDLFKK